MKFVEIVCQDVFLCGKAPFTSSTSPLSGDKRNQSQKERLCK